MNNLTKHFSSSTKIGLEYIYIKGSPHKAVKLIIKADKLSIRTSLNINDIFRIVRVEDLLVRLEEEIEVQKTLLNEVLSASAPLRGSLRDRLEIEANLEEAIAQKNNLLSLLKKNKEK